MRPNKLTLLAVLLGSLLGVLPASRAADADPKPADKTEPAGGSGAKARPARGERLQGLAEQLKLTDEQKEKIKPILQDERKKVRELRENKDLARQDRVAKLKEIREDIRAKVKPILTPEQLEKWNKLRSEGPGRRKQE